VTLIAVGLAPGNHVVEKELQASFALTIYPLRGTCPYRARVRLDSK
jgi:hypothetical protein